MTRIIKYRVRIKSDNSIFGYEWINEKGHWINTNISTIEGKHNKGTIHNVCSGSTSDMDLVREVFSNTYDKNKQEVYEGDYLKDSKGEIHKVGYLPNCNYLSWTAFTYCLELVKE